MYLLDSNILLELFLDQERADDVERLLTKVPVDTLFLSEFCLYSIGIVLLRKQMYDTFVLFVRDMLINGGIRVLRVTLDDMDEIVKKADEFNLDFDDAYQYIVAEKYGLTIVSFDSDFDRTKLGRKLPGNILVD